MRFKKNKKSFGSVISALIMFIAVVSITVGIVVAFQNYISQTQSALKFKNDLTVNSLRAAIVISEVDYNATSSTLYVYVKNIGEINLPTQNFDFYLDKKFIVRTNYNVTSPTNSSQLVDLVNPEQTVMIVYNVVLANASHEARVVTGYGSYADTLFNT